jgi:hypothetical protein
VRVLNENELNYLFVDDPLRVFFLSKPLGELILVIVLLLVGSVLNFKVNFFQLIDSPDSLFKEWTSQIFLCNLEFS